ncbi:site-2 protease family protein [Glutamicibacter protophormiae]|uniref:Zinc metalloprotease n=1 Tax=Glutamicibacter protophormiae TaxID=37930 RepID=A0ABS4XSZ7_GLUPR|nr:site-2 protease family protein [Glutamicibacter protophormiae]MBP2399607.1 Zn-dependent protease [Glutamicibacter protophormiae]QRQ80186.1 site-2 protease family protein [Glutamicibacter protophormiae]WPR66340.1 site-2 protease family protein [Glutamicibacter protophormiae]WPR69836.1 site-2 protease family protein [Glutamicibacter protophormiae]GGL87707.1 peptidase M50 [Glutamicibacter protophormiae]
MSEETHKAPGLKLGRIGGVPVYLSSSWFIITAVITVSMGVQLSQTALVPAAGAYLLGFACAVAIALAVLVHEVAHAMVARAFKWPDAHIVLTLMGGHTQFGSFKASPGASLWVALAGPLSNFALAGLGWGIGQLAELNIYLELLLDFGVYANLLLGAFNALPGLPLDGGRLVESIVWKATGSQYKGTIASAWVGRAIAAAVVFFFVVFPFLRGQEVQIITAVVGLMVAVFMWQATTALIGHSKLMLNLPTVIASDLMQPASAMASAATVADVHLRRAQRGGQVILVDPRGMPVGVVDEAALSRVDPAHAAQVPALAVSRALGEGAVVAEDSDGRELIDYLASVPTAEYAVISHRGVVVGLLHQADIVNAVTGRRK